jgi:hypothetical protein
LVNNVDTPASIAESTALCSSSTRSPGKTSLKGLPTTSAADRRLAATSQSFQCAMDRSVATTIKPAAMTSRIGRSILCIGVYSADAPAVR